MLILRGAPALSEFRVQKFIDLCVKASLPVHGVYAEYMHFADLSSTPQAVTKSVWRVAPVEQRGLQHFVYQPQAARNSHAVPPLHGNELAGRVTGMCEPQQESNTR